MGVSYFVDLSVLGLLDPKESAETCALRELKEETGFVGTVKHTSPGKQNPSSSVVLYPFNNCLNLKKIYLNLFQISATCLDPGVGETTAQMVTVEVSSHP